MAVARISPPATSHHRDVSPLGASRFETTYEPPVRQSKSPPKRQQPASAPPPPPSPQPRAIPTTSSSSRSSHQPADSVFSHAGTMDTALTSPSLSSSNYKLLKDDPHPRDDVSNDEWFARFHSDLTLDSTISDPCPDRAALAAVQNVPIYSADGTTHPFGSIYDPALAQHTRQLVLFVRHFYCGACQAFLQAMTASIGNADYFAIPVPTSIIVIGCGAPELIPHYKRFTGCPWPIYADPTRALFKKLGMSISMNLGFERPEYMKDISSAQWGAGQIRQIREELKNPEGMRADGLRKRDILLKGGHPMQIGGEFLFEEGNVVWCHRMRNYRGHTEIKVIRKLLELED
ncbi:unnamed protein product [Zymoseptoria tritici ST99CH_3D7]|uniref:Thioredoxin domain-containing protein n=1 Tax=Zymoseptoria tritici (strain ST99CH_3D7) TaxID=1276538 RepID=A0A1X7RZ95_ZYMT9|nr:unnamed protein product [Zymoseptoria tritici ST99CH_3D7]